MANEALRTLIQNLRRVAERQGSGRPSDAELLERFAVTRDQAAFEVLVWRHGPMVLSLCRRMVHHEQDAEDAFQATFLTLVRKAGSIAKRDAVGSWLYKVAFRVALEANARTAKRTEHETAGVETLAAKPAEDVGGRELHLAVGEEVNRLPDKYRVPLVLHCFEGKSSQEVAQQLGCAEATVRTRLARARERLRTRLARRGLALTAGLLGAGLAPSAVPAALVDTTIKAAAQFAAGKALAAGVVSAQAVALSERVLKYMFLSKLKHVAAAVVLVSVFGAGTGLTIRQALAQRPAAQQNNNAPKPRAQDTAQAKDDRVEIQGTWESWTTVTHSSNGEVSPPERLKLTSVITEDKIMRVGQDGFLEDEQSYKLDPTKSPKAIDITDRRLGDTFLGIYQLEGDTLKILYTDERPKKFPSEKDQMKPMVWKRVSRNYAPVAQRFANAPGCFWMINPTSPPASMGTLGIMYIYDKDHDGSVVITMAYAVRESASAPRKDLRPVLFDAGGNRYLPKFICGGSGSKWNGPEVGMYRWRMDPNVLPARTVAQVGIEALTADAHRSTAREALERAKIGKVQVLPWPQIGEAFSFVLTTIDGRKLRSEDFKGKVLLIDCWATWCSPCMALMPELKSIYRKWHPQGLEIVGISFDMQAETVRKICKSKGLTWPQIQVPDDEKVRALWQEASGISAIPRVLLIDQQGILQADTTDRLEERIAKLLGSPAQRPPAKPKP